MSRIDYDLFKIKGMAFDVDGVLSSSTCQVNLQGKPIRTGNVKDGYALQLAATMGFHMIVITGGDSIEIKNRMKLLGISDFRDNVADKLPELKSWMDLHNLLPEEVLYMGDDIPDLPCLRHVGLPCSPFDAAWEVRQESVYISQYTGGFGAVRDVVQQVLQAHGLWRVSPSDDLTW